MAARRSELDVLRVGLVLDTDQAIADLVRFVSRKATIKANVDLTQTLTAHQIPGIPGRRGVASYEEAFAAFSKALTVAQSRMPAPVRAQAVQTLSQIAASLATHSGVVAKTHATTDEQRAIASVAAEMTKRQVREIAARQVYPEFPKGKYVSAETGRALVQPRGERWAGISTADALQQKGGITREQYMSRQAANEQRRYAQQERDENYAAVSRNVDRRRMAAAERKMAIDRERNYQAQNRDENVAAKMAAQERKVQERQEQYADVSVLRGRRKAEQQKERDYQRQYRDEGIDARQTAIARKVQERQEQYADVSEIREHKRQQVASRKAYARQEQDENYAAKSRRIDYARQVREGIGGREAYVALRQDMIARPGLGGTLARSMEAAQARYTQTGATGGGIGGMLFDAKMKYGPAMANVSRIAQPIMSGMSTLMSGIASMSATIGSSMLSVGKSVVSHGATLVKGILHLPSAAFRSMTMIRHAFWNLTFMAGLAAGAAYATAKALAPAGQVELWQNQFATLLGLQRGLRGPKATAAGQGMARERIDWVTKEALTMKATIPEAVETARYLTVHNMFTKRMFKLAADLEQSFGVPLEELVRPFMYLKNQRLGQFIRLGTKFGMSPNAMREEGIDMRPMTKIRLRTPEWYATVYEKMAGRMERMFGGMREVTSGGYVTKLSNLSDAWFKLRADIGASALPAAKDAINAMTQAMSRIAAKFKGASFSGIGGFVTRAINYTGDVLTAEKPFAKMGSDIKSMWTGPEGLGQALSKTFANYMEDLPSYMKSTWDRLDSVLQAGAGYLEKVFETLPSYWDRFGITVKMSLADIFASVGMSMRDLGTPGGPTWMAGNVLMGAGTAIKSSAMDQAVKRGLFSDTNQDTIANRILGSDLDLAPRFHARQVGAVSGGAVGALALGKAGAAFGAAVGYGAGKVFGNLDPRVPIHARMGTVDIMSDSTNADNALKLFRTSMASGDYGTAAYAYIKAYNDPAMKRNKGYRQRESLTEADRPAVERALRLKAIEEGTEIYDKSNRTGKSPFRAGPGMPLIGSLKGTTIAPVSPGMTTENNMPLSTWGSSVMAGGLNFQHNTPAELQGTWDTLSILGAMTGKAKTDRVRAYQKTIPFAALERIDREAALSNGTSNVGSVASGAPIVAGDMTTDSISQTIIGTSKGLQEAANEQVDALKDLKKTLEVIQGYLQ